MKGGAEAHSSLTWKLSHCRERSYRDCACFLALPFQEESQAAAAEEERIRRGCWGLRAVALDLKLECHHPELLVGSCPRTAPDIGQLPSLG